MEEVVGKSLGDYDYAFISCVKTKRAYPCKAKDMYISPLFKKAYNYAVKRVPEERIYILSAKYGLIPGEKIIEPYEKTISHARQIEQKIWSYRIIKEMNLYGISKKSKILILAGGGYRKYIERVLPNADCPVRGLTIGQMLKFYKNETK